MNQAARSLLPLVLLSVFFARGEAHPAPLHPRNVGDIWADGLLFAERSTSDSTSGVYNLSSRDQNIADLTTLADQYGLIAQPWVWNFPAPGPAPGSSTNATAAVDVMTGQVLANVDGLILSRDGAEDDGSASSKDTAPLDEAASYANGWLVNNLNLYNSRAVVGDVNLAFVPDPLAVSTSASSAPAVGAPGQSVSVVGGDGVTIVQGANGADATTAPGGSAPTVLRVFYPNGSYSPSHSDPVGGTSFYPQPFLPPVLPGGSNQSPYTNALASNSSALSSAVNVQSQTGTAATSSSFPSLLLSYSVGFPANFDFVKGGKLPGLYSSVGLLRPNGTLDANTDGCSGGARDGVGESCWSARVMWRENGEGEGERCVPLFLSF